MLHDLVKDVFDQALVDLSDQTLPKLTPPDGNCEPVVTQALDELTKLSSANAWQVGDGDDLPAYDQLSVGLFYCQWYQAQQVNVAYSIIRPAIESSGSSLWPNSGASLHVVDFGCGAFAVGFGVALALSALVESGQPIPMVTITGIDYPSMLHLGQQLWASVSNHARQEARLGSFRTALEAIRLRPVEMSNLLPSRVEVRRAVGDRVWLTAFHVAYRSNLNSVSRDLRMLTDALRPDAGILTVPSRKAQLVSGISPFTAPVFEQQDIAATFRLSGNLPKITSWRWSLRQKSPSGYQSHGGLLRGNVTWQGEEQGKRPNFSLCLKKRG